jgi:soluble lytic murein transglycosylase-like protein
MGVVTPLGTNGVKGLPCILACALLCFTVHAVAGETSAVLTNVSEATDASSETPAIKIYKYRNLSGVQSYSDRTPTGIKYELVQFSCFACILHSKVDWFNTPLQLRPYETAINIAAEKNRVDPALIRAVIHAESAFKPGARSKKGALGLMQLMPDTAKDMGVANPLVPEDNIQGGVRYLAWLLEENSGNIRLATAAYNAGPGAVKRHNGIPPYEETQIYVKRVKILHDRYKKALTKTLSGHWVSQDDLTRR